jgi:hypothetical protein
MTLRRSLVANHPKKEFAALPIAMSLLLLTACGGAAIRWQPSVASQVPDSTFVRFAPAAGEAPTSGVALDWPSGRLRVITSRGDTIVVPPGSALEVRLKDKATHPIAGTIIGWAVGVAVSYAACAPPRTYCGEEDPTPLLGLGLGALIGSRIKTDWWVRVQWDAPNPPR